MTRASHALSLLAAAALSFACARPDPTPNDAPVGHLKLALQSGNDAYRLNGSLSLERSGEPAFSRVESLDGAEHSRVLTLPVGEYRLALREPWTLLSVGDSSLSDVTERVVELMIRPNPVRVEADTTTIVTLAFRLADDRVIVFGSGEVEVVLGTDTRGLECGGCADGQICIERVLGVHECATPCDPGDKNERCEGGAICEQSGYVATGAGGLGPLFLCVGTTDDPCVLDSDSDGTSDCSDACIDDPSHTTSGPCSCGPEVIDTDGDGVAPADDNCVSVFNPGQEDADLNGAGDACETGSSPCPAGSFVVPGDANRCVAQLRAIESGLDFTCAMTVHGKLACWGVNVSAGRRTGAVAGMAERTAGYGDLSAGAHHTCALKAGKLECWGSDEFGQTSGPNTASGCYVDVEAAVSQTCAISTTGRLDCWGWDVAGQVSGADAVGTQRFTGVSPGYEHTCAIARDGRLRCWGRDTDGNVSGPNASVERFHQVSAGRSTTCAVTTTDALHCWGLLPSGLTLPIAAVADVSVNSGGERICLQTLSGDLRCWGTDVRGELTGPNASTEAFQALSSKGYHTCGVTSDGEARCWGRDAMGAVSGPMSAAIRYADVAATSGAFCGVTSDGKVSCAGFDIGQPPDVDLAGIRGGSHHACGLIVDSDLVCWGAIGTDVSGPNADTASYLDVSAGEGHTCRVDTAGDLLCWGDSSNAAVAGPNASSGVYTHVSAGTFSTCALTAGGEIECWGSAQAPSAFAGHYTQVAAGNLHACGLTDEGALDCHPALTDAFPRSAGRYVSVAAGASRTCAVDVDGLLACSDSRFYDEHDANSGTGPFVSVTTRAYEVCALRADQSFACWGAIMFDTGALLLPPTAD